MRDRIKEFRRVPARELLANRKNWQRHPERQRAALQAIVAEVGFASAVVACETPEGLVLIDGHARVDGAKPDDLLPTLVLDVDESDADKLLAAMDAIAKMAERDDVALAELLESVTFDDANLRRMVADLDAMHAGEFEAPVEGELECALASGLMNTTTTWSCWRGPRVSGTFSAICCRSAAAFSTRGAAGRRSASGGQFPRTK